MIKAKTKTTDKDWREAIDNIESIVSKEYIDNLARETLEATKELISNGNNVIISYSAGKDSIVLEHILRPLGLKSILAYCDLEYPAFMEWVNNNKPKNCELINSGIDIDWLSKHEDMLFPDTSAKAGRWYDIVQHKVQNKYIKENKVSHIILGRRLADGNYCGTDGNGSYKKGECTVVCPIYKWRHEDILAYIHYNKLDLPSILYDYPDGYRQGTHNWASFILHDGFTKDQALERLWNIDKDIIIKASEKIKTIKEWYDEHRNN